MNKSYRLICNYDTNKHIYINKHTNCKANIAQIAVAHNHKYIHKYIPVALIHQGRVEQQKSVWGGGGGNQGVEFCLLYWYLYGP